MSDLDLRLELHQYNDKLKEYIDWANKNVDSKFKNDIFEIINYASSLIKEGENSQGAMLKFNLFKLEGEFIKLNPFKSKYDSTQKRDSHISESNSYSSGGESIGRIDDFGRIWRY